jgi:hypothetical protein
MRLEVPSPVPLPSLLLLTGWTFHVCVVLQQEEGKEEAKAAPPKQPFTLHVEAGAFTGSEIVVMLGEVRGQAV